MNKHMHNTLVVTFLCTLPLVTFGGPLKVPSSAITRGIQHGVTKYMGAPSPSITTRISRGISGAMQQGVVKHMDISAPLPAPKVVVAPTLPSAPFVQNLSRITALAQQANRTLFAIRQATPMFITDIYPAQMLANIQEKAYQNVRDIALPLTADEVDLLLAADQGEFFEIFDERDGLLVASLRQPLLVNVRPGASLQTFPQNGIWKIEKTKYEGLKQEAQKMTPQQITQLKQRAQYSPLGDGYTLSSDEFNKLLSTGNTDFFGEPFLALVQKHNSPVSSVSVFFPVKQNLIVSQKSLPAGSYVGLNEFCNGHSPSFLFDAQDLMRAFSKQMAGQLRQSFSQGGADLQPISILTEDGIVPLQMP